MRMRWFVITAVQLALVLLLPSGAAHAGYTDVHQVFPPEYHTARDSQPAIMKDGQTLRMWWGGGGTSTAPGDTIYYSERGPGRDWTPPLAVLGPVVNIERNDFLHTNDPTVVKGTFTDPRSGETFSHAMYYTVARQPVGGGEILLALSNDGITWVRYGTVVTTSGPVGLAAYGVGMGTAVNLDGQSAVELSFTDTSSSRTVGPAALRTFVANSSDGIHFSAPVRVTSAGLIFTHDHPGDVAFDPRSGDYFAVKSFVGRADGAILGFGVYRIPASEYRAGSGAFRAIGTVDTLRTGQHFNDNPALLRDPYGWVTTDYPMRVETYFGAGPTLKGRNIWTATVLTKPATLELRRVYAETGDRWESTGVTFGGSVSETVASLYQDRSTGRVPLFGCETDGDRYLADVPPFGCEGGNRDLQGVAGFVDPPGAQAPAGPPLFACSTAAGDRFTSNSSLCEGEGSGTLLGFAAG